MVPAVARLRPMMVRSRTDLPVPDPPTNPTISPRKTIEVELVVDDVVAELGAHAAQAQHDVPTVTVIDELAAFGHYTSASRKMIENTASSTMTQKIDSTTDFVVSWPTLSALPRTWRPSKQPMVAITRPKTGALIMPV